MHNRQQKIEKAARRSVHNALLPVLKEVVKKTGATRDRRNKWQCPKCRRLFGKQSDDDSRWCPQCKTELIPADIEGRLRATLGSVKEAVKKACTEVQE